MSAGRPVPDERGGTRQSETPVPASRGHAGAPETVSEGKDTGEGGSGALWAGVEALAALLEPEAFDPDQPAREAWRKPTQATALAHAEKVLDLGYRRLVEDDATIERLARAMNDAAAPAVPGVTGPARYSAMARAAVRALREDT